MTADTAPPLPRWRPRLGGLLLFLGGLGALLGGAIMPAQVQNEMEDRVAARVSVDSTGHRAFEQWLELDGYGWGMTAPSTHSYFVFDVTNAEAVVAHGERPVVAEVGPVTVVAHHSKQNVTFLSDNTVRFTVETWLELDPEDEALLDTVVSTPNVPYERLLRELDAHGDGEAALAAQFAVGELREVLTWTKTRLLALAKVDALSRLLRNTYEDLRWAMVPEVLQSVEADVRSATVPAGLTERSAAARADLVPSLLTEAYATVRAAVTRQELADAEQRARYESVQPVLTAAWAEMRSAAGVPPAAELTLARVTAANLPSLLPDSLFAAAELAFFPALMRDTYDDVVVAGEVPSFLDGIHEQLVDDEGLFFVRAQWRSVSNANDAWDLDAYTDDPTGAFRGGWEINVDHPDGAGAFVEPSDALAEELLDNADDTSFFSSDGYALWKAAGEGDASAVSQLIASCDAGMTWEEAWHVAAWVHAWRSNDLLTRDRQREWRTAYQTATRDPVDLDPDEANTQAGFELPDDEAGVTAAAAAYLWDSANELSFVHDDGYQVWRAAIEGDADAVDALVAAPAANVSAAHVAAIGDWITALYDTDFYQWALARQWASGECYDERRESVVTVSTTTADDVHRNCSLGWTHNATATSAADHTGQYNETLSVSAVVECADNQTTTRTTQYVTMVFPAVCTAVDLDPASEGAQTGLEVNPEGDPDGSPPFACLDELLDPQFDFALTNAAEGWPRWVAAYEDADEAYELSEDISFGCFETFTQTHVEFVLEWLTRAAASQPVWADAVELWRLGTCHAPVATELAAEAGELTKLDACREGEWWPGVSELEVTRRDSSPTRVTNYTLSNTTVAACEAYLVSVPRDFDEVQTLVVDGVDVSSFRVEWNGEVSEFVALENASWALRPALLELAGIVDVAVDVNAAGDEINVTFAGHPAEDVAQLTLLDAAGSVFTPVPGGTRAVPRQLFNATLHVARSRVANYSCDSTVPGWELSAPLGGPAVPADAAQLLWTPAHAGSLLNATAFSLWVSTESGDWDGGLGLSADERAVVSGWAQAAVDADWTRAALLDAWRLGSAAGWMYHGAVISDAVALFDGWEADTGVPEADVAALWDDILSDDGFRAWMRYAVSDGSMDEEWAPAVAAWLEGLGAHADVSALLLAQWQSDAADERPFCSALFGADAEFADDDDVVCSFAEFPLGSGYSGDMDLAALWDRNNTATGFLTEEGYASGAFDAEIQAWLDQWPDSLLVHTAAQRLWRAGSDADVVDLSARLGGEQDGFALGMADVTAAHAAMLFDAEHEYSLLTAAGAAQWEAAFAGTLPRSAHLDPAADNGLGAWIPRLETQAGDAHVNELIRNATDTRDFCDPLVERRTFVGLLSVSFASESPNATNEFEVEVPSEVLNMTCWASGCRIESNETLLNVSASGPNVTAWSWDAYAGSAWRATTRECPAPNGLSEAQVLGVAAWLVGWADHPMTRLAAAEAWAEDAGLGEVRAELLVDLWDLEFGAALLNATGHAAWRAANGSEDTAWLEAATAVCPANRTSTLSVELLAEATGATTVGVVATESTTFVGAGGWTATNVTDTIEAVDVGNASAPFVVNRTVVRRTLFHCGEPDGLSAAQVAAVADWLDAWASSAEHRAFTLSLWRDYSAASWALPFPGVAWLAGEPPCTLCAEPVAGWPLAWVLPADALELAPEERVFGNVSVSFDDDDDLFNQSHPRSVLTDAGVAYWRGVQPNSSVSAWLSSWAVHPITTEAVQRQWRQGEECTDLVPGTVGCQGGWELSEGGVESLGGGKTTDVGAAVAADVLDPAHALSLLNNDGLAVWLGSLDGCSTVDADSAACSAAADGEYTSAELASDTRNVLRAGVSGLHLRHVDYIVDTWLLAWLDSAALDAQLLAEHPLAAAVTDLPLLQLANASLTWPLGVVDLQAADAGGDARVWARQWSDANQSVVPRPWTAGFPAAASVATLYRSEPSFLDLAAVDWFAAALESEEPLTDATRALLAGQSQIARFRVADVGELTAQALLQQPYEDRASCEELVEALYEQPGSVGVTDSIYCSRNDGGYWLTGLGLSLGALRHMRGFLLHVADAYVFAPADGGLFKRATVREVLFDGYEDGVAGTGWAAAQPLGNASAVVSGARRCGSGDGAAFSVRVDLVGQYLVWDGSDDAEGSDGTQFKPNYAGERFGDELDPLDEFAVWWPETGRAETMAFDHSLLRFGIDVRRYTLVDEGEVVDLSAATNASLLYSAPHVGGDEVDGLAPSDWHHASLVDVEPMTGQAVALKRRGQTALQLAPHSVWHPNATAAAVPVFWSEVIKASTQADADDFNDDIGYWYNLSVKLQVAALFIGSLIAVFGIALLLQHCWLSMPKEEPLPELITVAPSVSVSSRPGTAGSAASVSVAPAPPPATQRVSFKGNGPAAPAARIGPSSNVRRTSAVVAPSFQASGGSGSAAGAGGAAADRPAGLDV